MANPEDEQQEPEWDESRVYEDDYGYTQTIPEPPEENNPRE